MVAENEGSNNKTALSMDPGRLRRVASQASAIDKNQKQEQQCIRRRRNSYSSFLSTKYETFHAKRIEKPKTSPFRKGHRPRSFSEVPANPHLAERAPPVAITNKTPIYEYYGFVMYLVSFVVLGIYIVWAYVPDEILHRLGITYYPNRYWALAFPIWLMTLVWFIFISFMSINLMNTASFDSFTCITDEHANVLQLDSLSSRSETPPDWMPELHDIPIGLVNIFLYQKDTHI